MGQKDFGYEIRLLLSTIIMREMNITNTHKKISFNSRFEQGKSYTGYTWTTLDSGLKDGIASWPQASLGLAAKHVSVIDISGGRSMPYSTTFMAHFFKIRTSLTMLVAIRSYYLLISQTPKISVHNSWKLLHSITNFVFYKPIYKCTCCSILLENI